MKHQQAPDGVPVNSSATQSGKLRRRSVTVKLPADLGIEDAAALHGNLTRHAGDQQPVTLDAADVQRIHTAALQLFCLFCSDRRRAGRETRWQKPSAALRSAAALLGATTLLSLGKA